MPFAAALSTQLNTARALEESCAAAMQILGAEPDGAFVFFTPHHADDAEHIAATIQQKLGVSSLIGCSGESIVGNKREVEMEPALSLFLARWGNRAVQTDPFQLVMEETPDGFGIMGWPDSLNDAESEHSAVILLGDPYTFPVDEFLKQMNVNKPGLRVVGGMASGGTQPGANRLLLGEKVFDRGAVGVLVRGPLRIRSIVSQGCRPIGRHYVITKAKENVIHELGGKTPLAQIQELWQQLSETEQRLFQNGLHVGRVINEYQGEFQRGDFLVRNVIGIDKASGALAITERVRVGQTIQFHVRDAETADEDLHALLQMDISANEQAPKGALLFTCNGRGTRLFAEENHDASVVAQESGNIPTAGFFAQGELGPVGGQNFIHGFTASVVLFED